MMGRSHAVSGLCTGLLVAHVLGLSVSSTLAFAATTAGYALLPDLDHPGAYASRLLGPVTRLLSKGLRRLSAAVYARTKGPRDENCEGTHRHLTHTLAFAVSLGLLLALGTWLSPLWGSVTVLGLGTLLAVAALGDWMFVPAVPALGTLAAVGASGGQPVGPAPWWLGVAVAVGCFTHCLGDSLTLSGCPFLWPWLIKGETWYELRPPIIRFRVFRWTVTIPLRFRTGKKFETRVMFPGFIAAAVLLTPGVWPVAINTISAITTRAPH